MCRRKYARRTQELNCLYERARLLPPRSGQTFLPFPSMYPFTAASSAAFHKGKRYCQVQRRSSVRCGYAPCILVLVVHNAAVAGATDRLLLGPCSSLETARKHESSRPPFGGARTVAGAAALLRSKPVSARPGPHQQKGEAKQ